MKKSWYESLKRYSEDVSMNKKHFIYLPLACTLDIFAIEGRGCYTLFFNEELLEQVKSSFEICNEKVQTKMILCTCTALISKPNFNVKIITCDEWNLMVLYENRHDFIHRFCYDSDTFVCDKYKIIDTSKNKKIYFQFE